VGVCEVMRMRAALSTDELQALVEVSKTVNAHLDLDTVLESVMAVAMDVMRVEASSLVLVDDETGDLLFHVAQGAKAGGVKPLRMKPGEGIVGWVIDSRKPALVNDVESDARFYVKADEASGFKTRAVLCVPLETRTRLWGAIEVLNKRSGGDFDDHDLLLCEALAAQAAVAIEIAMLHKQILAAERLAAIGQTIAGLAHCIKNVLNGIHGGSYMVDLALRKNDAPMMTKGWGIVRKNNAFMQELVLDMLTYSKEREPELEPADVNDIIEGVCGLMDQKAKDQGVSVTWTRNDQLGRVLLDPKGIRRCLLNLVSNAVDACQGSPEGHVEVRSVPGDGETFRIEVSDNGAGISEQDQAKLFQVFFSTKGAKGTGLGLAVTHKIIAEHHGTITVESELGQGATFVVTLPLVNKTNP